MLQRAGGGVYHLSPTLQLQLLMESQALGREDTDLLEVNVDKLFNVWALSGDVIKILTFFTLLNDPFGTTWTGGER